MQFQKGNTEWAKRGKKTAAERYRWTLEERKEILDELITDSLQTGTTEPATGRLSEIADMPDTWHKFGKFSLGFPTIDKLTYGFDPREVIVLGAGTNIGKTQLAIYIAMANAKRGHPVLYISNEILNYKLKNRFKACTANFDLTTIDISHSNDLDPSQLFTLMAAWSEHNPGGLIILDHFHTLYRGDKATAELSKLSRAIRVAAGDLGVGILLLAQLNRERYDPETGPTNHNFKETSYLEQDATATILAWRMKSAELRIKLEKSDRTKVEEGTFVSLRSWSLYITDDWSVAAQLAAKS